MKKKVGLTIGALILSAGAALVLAGPGFGSCGGEGRGGWHEMSEASHQGGFFRHRSGEMGSHLLRKLDRELELSDEQHDQIRSLLKQHQSEMTEGSVRGQVFGQMADLDPTAADYQARLDQLAEQQGAAISQRMKAWGSLYGEIYALLTPEQQESFNALKQQWRERWQQKRGKS